MDDIYFSDKKKNNPDSNKNSRRYVANEFTDIDYSDEKFALDFKTRGKSQAFSQKENFTVNLPDEKGADKTPVSRTPQGKPLSHTSKQPLNDVAKRPVSSSSAPKKATHSPTSPSSPQRNRTPQGARINHPTNQKPVRMSREGSHHNTPPKRPPLDRKKIIFISVLSIIGILFISLLSYGISAINELDYDDSIVPNAYVDESTLATDDDVVNILFIGNDARSDVEGQRSDTMILFSIDKKNKKLKLTSFLRDSFVYLPSKKYNTKLNSAFSYGGTQAVMDTLEYNFGVKIDKYIMVNFKAFRQLVDQLGGITVDVTAAEAKYMRDEVNLKHVKEGTNQMNGKTALWYCRIRYVDNDFKRTERQRKVITAIVSKALRSGPFKLMKAVKKVLPNVSTDISKGELISLAAGAALRYIHYDIVQQQIPAEGTWSNARISGQLVLKMNIEENANILKSFLYDKETKSEE